MSVNRCHVGDCRGSMRKLIADGVHVQTCVTSPPYFGLRDYGHPGQLGLEQTPQEYVANMVEVFSLVRDLLSDDGTLWLNLGDSYAGSWGSQGRDYSGVSVSALSQRQVMASQRKASGTGSVIASGLKPKDLIGIPWRVALALQADGWYLRQDIIWHKPNPMPESVTDRCTKSHEYIFLLSKSERYYYDHEAVKEPVALASLTRLNQDLDQQTGSNRVPGKTNGNMKAVGDTEHRNKRSVWEVATQPYSGAHFATFPPALIEPCILAGSRVNDIVFDPFLGSGTTAQVAQALGRQWIGCELNPEYLNLQARRTAQRGLILESAHG